MEHIPLHADEEAQGIRRGLELEDEYWHEEFEKMHAEMERWKQRALGKDPEWCSFHMQEFRTIDDREEHFAEEHADAFGCPACYLLSKMEVR